MNATSSWSKQLPHRQIRKFFNGPCKLEMGSVSLSVMTNKNKCTRINQKKRLVPTHGKRGETCASVSSLVTPPPFYVPNKVSSHNWIFFNRAYQATDNLVSQEKDLRILQMSTVQFFMRRRRYLHELLEGGTFWLSESPSVQGSTSWGSLVPCIATWATFQLKRVEQPGFSFQIVNTNMDEFSPRARRRSALLT